MNLLLTSTHNLDLTGKRLHWVTGSAEIAQKLKCRYLMFKGEFFMDQRIGVPYFQKLLIKGVSQVVLRSTLQKVALTTPGILRVDNFAVTIDAATRKLSISFEAILDTGEPPLDFDEVFII